MREIFEYKVIEKLNESYNSIVFRVSSEKDQHSYILKISKKKQPSREDKSKFKFEYDILSSLDSAHIIKPYSFIETSNEIGFLMEDFGGKSLSQRTKDKKIDLHTALQWAMKTIEGIETIHEAHIIHKKINPTNILISPDSTIIKIIDFSAASTKKRESQDVFQPGMTGDGLEYISPEQTGRMNRFIDYRSDYYSFGILLYEITTGVLPYQSSDPLELIHCHIAKPIIPPVQIVPEIPEVINDIIMKLLEKMPENRYQSSFGIKEDIRTCIESLMEHGKIDYFPIGQKDQLTTFTIPQKMYGKEEELKTLISFLNNMRDEKAQMLLVAGESGIGKSSFVHEIQKHISESRGYLVSGKCNEYKKNIPHYPIIEALQDFIKQLLAENNEQIFLMKKKIIKQTYPNTKLILNVLPELERITGPQLDIPPLDGVEAQYRFNITFVNFICSLASKSRPLVILLDDLHWTDNATLDIIEQVLLDKHNRHLLIVGTYRNNEVDNSHPLLVSLNNMKKKNISIETIILQSFTPDNIKEMLKDTVHITENLYELVELCYHKTLGNPFFLTQFLLSLYENKLIYFDKSKSIWRFNATGINHLDITDNVIVMMKNRLMKLPENTLQLIQFAACFGNTFNAQTLAEILKKDEEEIHEKLKDAIDDGYVIAAHNNYTFLHDKIADTAYASIDKESKQIIHLLIARLLFNKQENNINNEDQELNVDSIFEIVNHYNMCIDIIKDQHELNRIIELNFLAGRKAKQSGAFPQAFGFFEKAITWLDTCFWESNYSFTLNLHIELADCAYLLGLFDQSEKLCAQIIARAKSFQDEIKAHEITIQSLTSQQRFADALRTSIHVLKLLGVRMPQNPTIVHVLISVFKTRMSLFRKNVDDLYNLPLLHDSKITSIMGIMIKAGSAAYISAPNLMALFILKTIRLSIKHGNSPLSAFYYAAYGMLLCGIFGQLNKGYSFGALAIHLLQKLDAQGLQSRIFFINNDFIKHWKDPVINNLPNYIRGYTYGLETGDVEYASLNSHVYCQSSFLIGRELKNLSEEMQSYNDFMKRLNQKTALTYNEIYHQTVLNLLGNPHNPWLLSGNIYDENEMLKTHIKDNDNTALFHLYFNKLILNCLFNNWEESYLFANKALPYIKNVMGSNLVPIFYYYYSIACFNIIPYNDITSINKTKLHDIIKSSWKKLKKWSLHSKENYLNKYYLINAFLFQLKNNNDKTIEYFNLAIREAKNNQLVNEEGIAHELAARFWKQQGHEMYARTHFIEAYYCYKRWGANSKIKALIQQHPFLADINDEEGKIYTNDRPFISFDKESLLKAYQAITSEIELEKLITKLIQIILENAGAQKGILLLFRDNKWTVEASGSIHTLDQVDFHSTPLEELSKEDNSLLSLSIINYVSNTQESVLLQDASTEKRFHKDDYIITYQPKSLLCMPIVNKGKISGCIYLENNLATGAFTTDNLMVLQLLLSQVAISLENAFLYQNLENEISTRTNELNHTYKSIKKDLLLASKIQKNILPKLPANLDTIDLYAAYIPMTDVGGDIYDIFMMDNNNIRIFLADATGHGIQASLITMLIKSEYEKLKHHFMSPSELLATLNNEFISTYKSLMVFFTCFVLDINMKNRSIRTSGAGHLAQYHVRDKKITQLPSSGKMIGLMNNSTYSDNELEIIFGDKIFLFTDGLTEEFNNKKEEFGEKKLFETIKMFSEYDIKSAVDNILFELNEFVGNNQKNDDIILIGIGYKNPAVS